MQVTAAPLAKVDAYGPHRGLWNVEVLNGGPTVAAQVGTWDAPLAAARPWTAVAAMAKAPAVARTWRHGGGVGVVFLIGQLKGLISAVLSAVHGFQLCMIAGATQAASGRVRMGIAEWARPRTQGQPQLLASRRLAYLGAAAGRRTH